MGFSLGFNCNCFKFLHNCEDHFHFYSLPAVHSYDIYHIHIMSFIFTVLDKKGVPSERTKSSYKVGQIQLALLYTCLYLFFMFLICTKCYNVEQVGTVEKT